METSLRRRHKHGTSLIALEKSILGLGLLLTMLGGVFSQEPIPLHEHAEIYVDQYFEPNPSQKLSSNGLSKSSALGHFAIGRLQENQGQTEKAMASYLKVLELESGNVKLARETAQMLARAGRQKQAKELLEKSLASNSESAFPYIILSEFLSSYHGNNQDNKDRSLELAKEAVEKFPTDPLTYEHLSKQYLLGKRRSDAQDLLESALEVESKDPVFWLRLGKAAGRVWPVRLKAADNTKEISTLNQYYDRANEFAGEDDMVLLRSADFYASTQQYDKAEEIYSSVVKRLTGRLDIRKKLASIYKVTNDTESYIKVLDSIIQIDPADVNAHRELAAGYRREKQMELAIKHQLIALKLGKGSVDEYLALSREMEINSLQLHRDGKKEEARKLRQETVKFIREAASLFPMQPQFHLLVTYPLRNLDRKKEALEHLEKYEAIATEENPELLNEYFYFDFGAVSEQNGEIERAGKLFTKCLGILSRRNPQPSDDQSKAFAAQVYNYLGYMWVENDMHIHQAGQHIERAVELNPDSAAIADSLGWYYFKMKRYDDALKELLRSEGLLKNDPDFEQPDPVILDHIGQTYFALDQYEKAIEYMQSTIKFDEDDKQEYKDRLKEYQKRKAKVDAEKATKPSAEEDKQEQE